MALYRKYRPASFAELIGQEQVTEPLSVALDNGRINHAYLFSGPRGCGKTSSARILARSLNCVEGPTSTPCGVCNSCVSLAPGGPGNLDVTEMDAASHRGVEDMRALRDRAIYAPAESRYRVFIIDEAHMITNEGFNALLKIVEEPPAHLIFIFATTEPDKVIQTIRSRTHHYPFRLLTPQSMKQLISSVAAEEGALIEESVYPLLIQAGGGSPRDTLSVLDQLLAGTGPEGLTYEKAVPLLGITDAGLLDATVGALATGDAGGLFTTIDDVIEAGHDPRRFALDLLDHFRDLMILTSVPNAFELDLVTAPAGRQDVLKHQAQQFTGGQLANLATTLNEGISDLRGATSARLLLEVLFGHLLVESRHAPAPVAPSGRDAAASVAQSQAHAAVESGGGAGQDVVPGESAADRWLRQRRESGNGGGKTAPQRGKPQAPAPAPAQVPEPARPEPASPEPQQDQQVPPQVAQRQEQQTPPTQPAEQTPPVQPQAELRQEQPAEPAQQAPDTQRQPDFTPAAQQQTPSTQPAQPEPSTPAPEQPAQSAAAPTASPAELGEKLRTDWAKIRKDIMSRNRTAGIMLAQAKVLGVREDTLVLGHNTGVLAERLNTASNNDDIVAVVNDYVSQPLKVECIIGTDPAAAGFTSSAPAATTWSPTRSTPREQHAAPTGGGDVPEESERPAEQARGERPTPPAQPAPPAPQTSGWRSPAALGGEAQQPAQPAAPQTPSQPESPAQQPPKQEPAVPGWQEAARQGTQAAAERAQRQRESPTFGNGVPLPPEPGEMAPPPEEPPYDPGELNRASAQRPPQQVQGPAGEPEQRASASVPPAAMSRDEEEEMMLKQAQEPGQADRRDAMQIAVELLSDELGAKRV